MNKTEAKKIFKAYFPNAPRGLKSLKTVFKNYGDKSLFFELEKFKNEVPYEYSYIIIDNETKEVLYDEADGELTLKEIRERFNNIDINQTY